jgi:hypothetical protein
MSDRRNGLKETHIPYAAMTHALDGDTDLPPDLTIPLRQPKQLVIDPGLQSYMKRQFVTVGVGVNKIDERTKENNKDLKELRTGCQGLDQMVKKQGTCFKKLTSDMLHQKKIFDDRMRRIETQNNERRTITDRAHEDYRRKMTAELKHSHDKVKEANYSATRRIKGNEDEIFRMRDQLAKLQSLMGKQANAKEQDLAQRKQTTPEFVFEHKREQHPTKGYIDYGLGPTTMRRGYDEEEDSEDYMKKNSIHKPTPRIETNDKLALDDQEFRNTIIKNIPKGMSRILEDPPSPKKKERSSKRDKKKKKKTRKKRRKKKKKGKHYDTRTGSSDDDTSDHDSSSSSDTVSVSSDESVDSSDSSDSDTDRASRKGTKACVKHAMFPKITKQQKKRWEKYRKKQWRNKLDGDPKPASDQRYVIDNGITPDWFKLCAKYMGKNPETRGRHGGYTKKHSSDALAIIGHIAKGKGSICGSAPHHALLATAGVAMSEAIAVITSITNAEMYRMEPIHAGLLMDSGSALRYALEGIKTVLQGQEEKCSETIKKIKMHFPAEWMGASKKLPPMSKEAIKAIRKEMAKESVKDYYFSR